MRCKRVDDGHYLVPGTDWEVVREPDGIRWAIWDGNDKIKTFPDYSTARKWAIKG